MELSFSEAITPQSADVQIDYIISNLHFFFPDLGKASVTLFRFTFEENWEQNCCQIGATNHVRTFVQPNDTIL
jgi:hypothetical protein